MRVLNRVVACLALALPPTAGAGEFGFDALQKLIESRQIDGVESLVAALPPDLRAHYTLVFASRSLQGATPANPRVILFGADAQFVLAFNGDPTARGFNAVETMEFDSRRNEFRFRELLFSSIDSQRHLTTSEVNPARCAACHDRPGRPIWDTPPAWPGVYGERYRAGLSSQEASGMRAFLALQSQHPRYRYLLGAQAFGERGTYVPDPHAVYNGVTVEPPNARLSILLSTQNVRRILAQMAARPAFAPHRYVLLAAAEDSCGPLPDFYPERVRASLASDFQRFGRLTLAADRRQATAKALRRSDRSAVNRGGLTEAELNRLRFVAERGIGVHTSQWTLALERNTFDLAAPEGAVTLTQALFELVASGDPALRDLHAYRTLDNADAYCEQLRRESRRELEAWYALTSAEPAPQVAAVPVPRPALVDRCIECHDGDVGPAIPFADPDLLARRLGGGAYPRGRLLDEILYRLAPESGDASMPRGVSISAEERRDLEDYFLGLRTPTPGRSER